MTVGLGIAIAGWGIGLSILACRAVTFRLRVHRLRLFDQHVRSEIYRRGIEAGRREGWNAAVALALTGDLVVDETHTWSADKLATVRPLHRPTEAS